MKVDSKKVTFSLPVDILEKYKQYAKKKHIASVNSGVREAMEIYAVKIEKEQLHKAMLKAAKDPAFIKDLEESMEAFDFADNE